MDDSRYKEVINWSLIIYADILSKRGTDDAADRLITNNFKS